MRSTDDRRANADPLDPALWPVDRHRLIDDLWALALANLSRLREFDGKAVEMASLSGRNLEPWRAVLAMALWLQEDHGIEGLFQTLEALSVAYQDEQIDMGVPDLTRLPGGPSWGVPSCP